MTDTKIEWTHRPGTRGRTWNPTRGCERTSPGCGGGKVEGAGNAQGGCYAERQAWRFAGPGQPYQGLVHMTAHGPRWTGEGRLIHEMIGAPLRWREPSTIFVDSMSDLFFERFTDEQIDTVFGVMNACEFQRRGGEAVPWHRFIILTKRAERMRAYLSQDRRARWADAAVRWAGGGDLDGLHDQIRFRNRPPPHITVGVSCERQKEADIRIPLLVDTPAAVRIVSAEPLLGPIDFSRWFGLKPGNTWEPCLCPEIAESDRPCIVCEGRSFLGERSGLHQIIVGGESGPGARPCDVEWIRSIVRQCKAAAVPVFVKQLGAVPRIPNAPDDGPDVLLSALRLRSKKGGDMDEWPEDLRVREWPAEHVEDHAEYPLQS